MANLMIYGTGDDTTNYVGTAVTGANTYYSDIFQMKIGQPCSIHTEWTSTPTGTFTLWYSNKMKPNVASDADWVQDTSFPASNPAGSASKSFISISLMTARSIRLKYVNSASSGTILCWVEMPDNQ